MAKIMILDDVLEAGVVIKRILERKGYEVTAFTEEEDALEFAEREKPDLAILDIKLKRMTGLEVLEDLRRRSPGTKAIMLTGYPTMETAKEALRLGAVDYCVKPVDRLELENKTAEVLRQEAPL